MNPSLQHFTSGKSEISKSLLEHFINEYSKIGNITVEPTKSMIGISNSRKRITWITQLGRNFVHIVFPFRKAHPDNLCFTKIAQVPGDAHQFNHHFRMLGNDDVNEEVKAFMKMAFEEKDLE